MSAYFYKRSQIWILAILSHFCHSCQISGGETLPRYCWQTNWHKIAFTLGIEHVIYIFSSNRIAHWQLESGKKWDLVIFWSFFALWGYIFNPQVPSSSFYLLSLTSTTPGITSKKVLTTWKFFLNFFKDFCCTVTPSHLWPNVTPLGALLWLPLPHNSFFTSIQSLSSEFYHSMYYKIKLTTECHPTLIRGHSDGFWPFWAIFAILTRFKRAMHSHGAAGRPTYMKLCLSLVQKMWYTWF